ncbi:MAG: NAD-dependent epimerase/dehydratase [Candidatus Magasanikbacteria bacterium GW2011_GWC2_41_17]|uniref:NAD-dependent epimerase/dehydratase n=2 Tax=Candidatus Magasanikiibacteriota TaxID=1752731 RepID=A0A0G0YVD4_9BACT|nr:MAG: NAD-dependent epimerase/dehydratase [Candidatus Magasanikbacteria bacterium GW2011_GWC2_41_17]KKS13626.1 MAG: NAD-dependent epimerase/dehydratase [Candidatus Magasanikbacteria bacterium GW2011_GWA2_41_55]
MSKYLVTGGAGFIGANLVKQLLADGHQVVVLDNYAAGKKEDRMQPGAEYIEGDIRNEKDLNKVCPGVDTIFHLAALPRVTFTVENPELTHDVNINGTLKVLMAARRHKVRRVIFSSSSSTYGGQDAGNLLKEDSAIKMPVSPYALHKLTGEHYCRIFSELYGIETVSLIYFNVYGPYFDPDGAYALVIGKFLKQKKQGLPMPVCGDGEYFRDYTHVKDVVRANILAAASKNVGKGETINIGCGRPTTVNELVKIMGGEFVFVDPRPGDQRFSGADNAKAKRLLGWEPSIKLEDGIKMLKADWQIK